MPEVVEVRKNADFIKKHLKNININNINILKGRYIKKPFSIKSSIFPLKILDIKTKGKFLYFILENNTYFLCTLGLTGGWTFFDNIRQKYLYPFKYESTKTYLNNLNIEIVSNKGSLFFFDQLSFGTFKIIFNEDELLQKLKTIGPDIMDNTTDIDIFTKQILKKKNLEKVIGNVLVDQKIVSGIGNYLRSDILWLSCISPFRKIKDLNNVDLEIILENAKLLTCGEYSKKCKKNGDKLPKNYNRDFFVYKCNTDIYGNNVISEKLYEGSAERIIYWVKERQV